MTGKTQFLSLPANAAMGFPARRLAYVETPGAGPKTLWMGGFRSDLTSTKAQALADAATAEGRASLRFDYSAHGQSDGDFAAATLSQWLDDSLEMIRARGGERPVIVGSSMGGWLALIACLQLVAEGNPPGGLILIAPAVDFTETLMWDVFPEAIRQEITRNGVWYRHSEYAPEPYPITMNLIEDGRKHLLLRGARAAKPLKFGVPIHILQGGQDPDVPEAHVRRFIERLAEDEASLTLIPDGNHRLSREEDIATLVRITAEMAARLSA